MRGEVQRVPGELVTVRGGDPADHGAEYGTEVDEGGAHDVGAAQPDRDFLDDRPGLP
ncbi:hypothetical protein ACTWPT_37690 [Nonomuraea sp. 3N208]|uniref:hypothetical protein n=1 Tax=Nonomuraea sp. 3N208 TaxID=3457421 RepID=UPI003FD5E168